jgi:hypothetical protein
LDRTARRAAALQAAASLPWPHAAPAQLAALVVKTAVAFDEWLGLQPPTFSFTITADAPVDRPTQEGPGVSLTFPDTQQDTLRIAALVDAEGATVTDTFTWTVDNATVLMLTPAADTMSCLIVPGTAAGAATVTATSSNGVARTFAVDVTVGPTASFQITSDGPVDRPAPAPAPAPAA